jgi:hypothetical protein
MAHKDFGCGRAECHASMSIAETMTYGTGNLDSNGFWQFPCAVCELANHVREQTTQRQPSRIFDSRYGNDSERFCLFCGRVVVNGEEIVDLAGPAIGTIIHSACNDDAAASVAYV